MKPSAPKVITWWVAVVLGALGIIAHLGTVAALDAVNAFWLVTAGLAVLVLATLVKGL